MSKQLLMIPERKNVFRNEKYNALNLNALVESNREKDSIISKLRVQIVEMEEDFENQKNRLLNKELKERSQEDQEKEKFVLKYVKLKKIHQEQTTFYKDIIANQKNDIKNLNNQIDTLSQKQEAEEEKYLKILQKLDESLEEMVKEVSSKKTRERRKKTAGNIKIFDEENVAEYSQTFGEEDESESRKSENYYDSQSEFENMDDNVNTAETKVEDTITAEECSHDTLDINMLQKALKKRIKSFKEEKINLQNRNVFQETYQTCNIFDQSTENEYYNQDTDVESYDYQNPSPEKKPGVNENQLLRKQNFLFTQESIKDILNKNIQSKKKKGNITPSNRMKTILEPSAACLKKNEEAQKYYQIYIQVLKAFYTDIESSKAKKFKSLSKKTQLSKQHSFKYKRDLALLVKKISEMRKVVKIYTDIWENKVSSLSKIAISGTDYSKPMNLTQRSSVQQNQNNLQADLFHSLHKNKNKLSSITNAPPHNNCFKQLTYINNINRNLSFSHLSAKPNANINSVSQVNGHCENIRPPTPYSQPESHFFSKQTQQQTCNTSQSYFLLQDAQLSKILNDDSLSVTDKELFVYAILNQNKSRINNSSHDVNLEDLYNSFNSRNTSIDNLKHINISNSQYNITNQNNYSVNNNSKNCSSSVLNHARLHSIMEEDDLYSHETINPNSIPAINKTIFSKSRMSELNKEFPQMSRIHEISDINDTEELDEMKQISNISIFQSHKKNSIDEINLRNRQDTERKLNGLPKFTLQGNTGDLSLESLGIPEISSGERISTILKTSIVNPGNHESVEENFYSNLFEERNSNLSICKKTPEKQAPNTQHLSSDSPVQSLVSYKTPERGNLNHTGTFPSSKSKTLELSETLNPHYILKSIVSLESETRSPLENNLHLKNSTRNTQAFKNLFNLQNSPIRVNYITNTANSSFNQSQNQIKQALDLSFHITDNQIPNEQHNVPAHNFTSHSNNIENENMNNVNLNHNKKYEHVCENTHNKNLHNICINGNSKMYAQPQNAYPSPEKAAKNEDAMSSINRNCGHRIEIELKNGTELCYKIKEKKEAFTIRRLDNAHNTEEKDCDIMEMGDSAKEAQHSTGEKRVKNKININSLKQRKGCAKSMEPKPRHNMLCGLSLFCNKKKTRTNPYRIKQNN